MNDRLTVVKNYINSLTGDCTEHCFENREAQVKFIVDVRDKAKALCQLLRDDANGNYWQLITELENIEAAADLSLKQWSGEYGEESRGDILLVQQMYPNGGGPWDAKGEIF